VPSSGIRLIRCARVASLAALLLGCGNSKPVAVSDPDAGAGLASDATADDGDASVTPVGCLPPRSTSCLEPQPSFAREIVPILDVRCNGCHDPAIPDGPWPLHDYQDVVEWKGVVVDSLLNCTMPPPDSAITLPEEERQRLFAWVACDTPDN
jgi:hypothetical protein